MKSLFDKDALEARKIYDKYGKYFIALEEKNEDRINVSRIVISLLGEVKGKKILDAGCGGGKDCLLMARKGAKVVGIDISPRMIEIARQRCNSQVEFYVRDMQNTDFLEGEFDVIVSLFSLMYKKNLSLVFKEFRRILKKGGELILAVPHPIWKMMRYTKNYFFRGKRYELHGKMKLFNYYRTTEDYINTLVSSGFVLKEVKEI
ncbi:MAG: class I SAM-dependent methyltransferase, partial [Candidatus Aenigmarchaeota archaeon]|nr:class I SAM-dependent methyltransferase [Candidatus Aenigmarchaeota archaeon]